MEVLYGLAKLSISYKGVINQLLPLGSEGLLRKLSDIVFLNEELDNQSVMLILYGKEKVSDFSKLKQQLKDILVKTLILQDSFLEPKDSRANQTLIQHRHILCINAIFNQDRSLAIKMAELALKRAIEYHLTDQILIVVKLLIRHYSIASINQKKLGKYIAIQNQYLQIQFWEARSESYFLELQNINQSSLGYVNNEVKNRAKKYVDEVNSSNINTYTYFINKYKLNSIYFEYQKDYKSLLNLSESTLLDLKNPKFKTNININNINLRRMWALIQSGKNEDAIIIGIASMRTKLIGTLSWYFSAHYTLKAYLYKQDYLKAIDLISQMIGNFKFSNLALNYQELFTTTLGYIHLIVDSGLAGEFQRKEGILPKFRLYKFLNNTPVFNKDKRGINVSILLMHIAFLLQRKDYNAIIDRIDSLKQYAYKYLRKDDTFRSNCMIKMVLQMTRADFNPVRTERYTKDLFNQLQEVKLAGSGENIETEIIPHEVLWDIMLRALEQPDKVKVTLRE